MTRRDSRNVSDLMASDDMAVGSELLKVALGGGGCSQHLSLLFIIKGEKIGRCAW